MRIAIVGAESTGKSNLAAELAAHFRTQGQQVHLVDEVLREWCMAQQRTPRPHEQMAIAQEQARRAHDAGGAAIVVADTTPLMVAVYSDMLFNDKSLYPFALAHQQTYDLTLLTALDLPWVDDGLQRDGPHVQGPVDTLVRAALQGAGIRFQLVAGAGALRCANALAHISRWQQQARPL
jgi:nicotinamide riboside kinase